MGSHFFFSHSHCLLSILSPLFLNMSMPREGVWRASHSGPREIMLFVKDVQTPHHQGQCWIVSRAMDAVTLSHSAFWPWDEMALLRPRHAQEFNFYSKRSHGQYFSLHLNRIDPMHDYWGKGKTMWRYVQMRIIKVSVPCCQKHWDARYNHLKNYCYHSAKLTVVKSK